MSTVSLKKGKLIICDDNGNESDSVSFTFNPAGQVIQINIQQLTYRDQVVQVWQMFAGFPALNRLPVYMQRVSEEFL